MRSFGHGFDTQGDPRIAHRQMAADAQRASFIDPALSEYDQARRHKELAEDEEIAIERALTWARRARS